MKRIIFSIYNEIPDNCLENNNPYHGDSMPKSMRAKLEFQKHYTKLKKCKEEYAESCGAEFRIFTANPDPKNDMFNAFKSKFGHHFGQNRKDYDIMNFYKLFLFEEMANYFDEVIYMDFDVVPNTFRSPFEYWDMKKINVRAIDCNKKNIWNTGALNDHFRNTRPFDDIVKDFDKHNMYCKMMAKRAMLMTQNIQGTELLTNTGILGGNSNIIKQLKMFDDFVFKVDTLIQAKDEQMFGPVLSDKFFLNNEILFSFNLEHKNIPWNNLSEDWHFMMLSGNMAPNKDDLNDAKLIHVIDKKFERIFKIVK